jgi:hypothetical protein
MVIADGDVPDCSLELDKCSIASDPRVINTLTLGAVRNVAPFMHFPLFFSLSLALTHILLS